MSRKSYKWIAVTAALMAVLPAHAQSRHRPFIQRDADAGMQRMPPRQDQAPRELQQRDDSRLPPGRMSPEERRQLRRDINEAGRDLYRHPSRR